MLCNIPSLDFILCSYLLKQFLNTLKIYGSIPIHRTLASLSPPLGFVPCTSPSTSNPDRKLNLVTLGLDPKPIIRGILGAK